MTGAQLGRPVLLRPTAATTRIGPPPAETLAAHRSARVRGGGRWLASRAVLPPTTAGCSRVPLTQHVERRIVIQCEPSNKPATDAERSGVSMLASDCRWDGRQVLRARSRMSAVSWRSPPTATATHGWRHRTVRLAGKSAGLNPRRAGQYSTVTTGRRPILVIEEPRQPRDLRARCRRLVGPEFASELLLQSFDALLREPGHAPQHVQPIR